MIRIALGNWPGHDALIDVPTIAQPLGIPKPLQISITVPGVVGSSIISQALGSGPGHETFVDVLTIAQPSGIP